MKTHKIVFEHDGEVSYTSKSPRFVLEDFKGDLAEKKNCILSNDNWMSVTVDKYAVQEISLPDWLDPREWLTIHANVAWRYAWGWAPIQTGQKAGNEE